MKTKYTVILLVLSLTVFSFAGISYAVSDSTQVKLAAEKGLSSFKILLTNNEGYKQFNITSIDELNKATLGDPYENWVLELSTSLDTNSRLVNQAKQAGVYTFPVIIDGKIATDMTVILDPITGQWKAIDFGGKAGKEITEINEKLVSTPKIINFAYSNVRLAAFLEADKEILYPINGTSERIGMPIKKGYQLKDIRNKLETLRCENLKQYDEARKNNTKLLGGNLSSPISINTPRASLVTRLGLFLDSF